MGPPRPARPPACPTASTPHPSFPQTRESIPRDHRPIRARRRLAQKRAAELTGDLPAEVADPGGHRPEDVLAVHQALDRLAGVNPRQEQLVELHYFSGLTLDETAEVLEVSRRTAMRDWKAVRIWLHGELKATARPSDQV